MEEDQNDQTIPPVQLGNTDTETLDTDTEALDTDTERQAETEPQDSPPIRTSSRIRSPPIVTVSKPKGEM